MEKLKPNQMTRGLVQSLYKYLPQNWIDFYNKQNRISLTAFVNNWNCIKLEGINEQRLFKRINSRLNQYSMANGKIKNFEQPLNKDNYDVLTPKRSVVADIFSEVSPLTFFCKDCKKIHYYESGLKLNQKNSYFRCEDCNSFIQQIKLVYACPCGWAGPVKPIECKQGDGIKNLKYAQDFSFVCRKHPYKKLQMIKKCESCNAIIYPKNALDLGLQIPQSITMIDLVKSKKENFISEHKDGSMIILANKTGKLSKKKLDRLVEKGSSEISVTEKEERFNELVMEFVEKLSMSEEQAREIATVAVEKSDNELTEALEYIETHLSGAGQENYDELAIQILEYETVINSREKSTLKDAIEVSKKLNTYARPEEYEKTLRGYGFSKSQVSGDIPFIISSYGYTRKETQPAKATLMGFPSENNVKKNIYATKLVTEGVLFEVDKTQILNWLIKNDIVKYEQDNLPEMDNESDLQMWFFNNIDSRGITPFEHIDKDRYKITGYVYTLLHSMSHSLLRQAAQLCGLDKNSLSEYIFPNIPAFLIYCQSSQGFNIGALFNLFEAYFDQWLKSTIEATQRCIFDPICIDRDFACAGCIYLNEISCCHFNKDLDRRLLLGYYDKTKKERTYGFWEDID